MQLWALWSGRHPTRSRRTADFRAAAPDAQRRGRPIAPIRPRPSPPARTARPLFVQRLGALLLPALLAACASTGELAQPQPQPPVAAPSPRADDAPRSEAPTPAPPRKSVVQKRGGGYYKDDGPGDDEPLDLDTIPDAEPRAEPLHRFANRPYNVFGKDYVPLTGLEPWRERGMASWYGRRFHGARTSSGEPYDMYAMTAAHPTLPIPSYARVTNLSNGRSVVVRVNDRGPFHPGRIVDLSWTAAAKLGYVEQGSTEVELEMVIPEGVQVLAQNVPPVRKSGSRKPAPRPPARPAEPPVIAASPSSAPAAQLAVAAADDPLLQAANAGEQRSVQAAPTEFDPAAAAPQASARGIFLQLGAFNTSGNAESFRSFVSQELAWLRASLEVFAQAGRFRLHAGPFSSLAEAREAADRIASTLKFKPFVVQR